MMDYTCKNAILFLTFNRLDTTQKVLESIAKVCPTRIYLASDGPRNNKPEEKDKITSVREFLLNNITWECEIKTLFNDKNLGCKKAISSAISWFFSHESQGIILEDDCLPNISFFRFVDIMLEKYKNNENIFLVGGFSVLDFNKNAKALLKESYFFSKCEHIWGWASWARAWEKYEIENKNFDLDFASLSFNSNDEKQDRYETWSSCYKGEIDSWAYPWGFSIYKNNGLCINPKNNMIKNIGLNRDDATHTIGVSKFSDMATYELDEIIHPKEIARNIEFDKIDFIISSRAPTLWQRLTAPHLIRRATNKIKRMCSNL